MPAAIPAPVIGPSVARRRDELFDVHQHELHRRTDMIFAAVMALQYAGGVIAASIITVADSNYEAGANHPNVGLAWMLGLAVAAPVWLMTMFWPGRPANRFIIAIAQMQMSGLLIHISGGRIETHFHIFGSLAFLGFYRDWRVLLPATAVVVANLLPGLSPSDTAAMGLRIYPDGPGTTTAFIEHLGWLLFACIFIAAACIQGRKEMLAVAERQALLEETMEQVEMLVVERTKELHESEARKVAMLESALDGILSMDTAGKLNDANRSAEAMFGCGRGGLLGRSITHLLRSNDVHEEPERWLASLRASEVGVRVAATGKRLTGDFPVELTVSPVEVEGAVGFTLFVRDLTEQRRLEAKVAHGQKMETIGRLSTGIAHEINTPNQYIADNVRFLDTAFGSVRDLVVEYRALVAQARNGGPQIGTLNRIHDLESANDVDFLLHEIPSATAEALDGVERVGGIVKAMRDFAHPGSIQRELVDVNAIVSGAATVSRNEWKHVAQLSMKLEDGIPRIMGNSGDLGQAVLNLIINASHAVAGRKPGEPVGKITVRTRYGNEHVLIEVEDDGCGIPEAEISKIFDPFYTTKGVGLGTGQGLSFVHGAVVQRMNGDVEVTSKPGKGTCFTLRIPSTAKEAVH